MNSPANLSFSEAMKIANEAVKNLSAAEQAASICVVNTDGRVLVQYCMDEARVSTIATALLKARLTAKTGRRTRYLRDAFKDPENDLTPEVLGVKDEECVPYAGGVPIYMGQDEKQILLGSIGISNLSENDDEQYAINAVEKVGYISCRK